jgi:hypothetical protein
VTVLDSELVFQCQATEPRRHLSGRRRDIRLVVLRPCADRQITVGRPSAFLSFGVLTFTEFSGSADVGGELGPGAA